MKLLNFVSINHMKLVTSSLLNVASTTITYVTGSAKTSLIAHDMKFDFITQTQSLMNALSNITATE